MSKPDPRCPQCREAMEEGYVLELADGNRRRVSQWIEGEPEKSFWFGLKTDGHEQHPITAYRCTRCGLLQHYAIS